MLPANGQEMRTKVSLMVSSNDLPDVLMPGLSVEATLDYGSKGAFVPLNRYLENPSMAPNWAAIPGADKALMKRAMTMADGNIYTLVNFSPQFWNFTPYRYYINKAWLDKLGLGVPKTTDELKKVLLAFRDKDPNGNGRKDEIPLYGLFAGGYGENITTGIINSFIFYNPGSLSLDNTGRKVVAPFVQPAFRKALGYLNDLFRENLIGPSLFTDNEQQFRAILNAKPNIVGFVSSGSNTHWANFRENPNFLEMAMMPPLTGPEGVSYTPYKEYSPGLFGMISSRCKDQDRAFKFLESFFNPEISTIVRFGEENVDWSRKPEDLAKASNAYVYAGIYPSLTLVILNDTWGTPHNKHWRNIGPRYEGQDQNTSGNLVPPFDPANPLSMLNAYNYQWYLDRHPEHVLPDIKFTLNEATQLSEVTTGINEYISQSVSEFITGIRNVNSDSAWDAYLGELEKMGLRKWIAGSQAAFDRMEQ
jgi:putative aldouronate transport system substrate-binding protein